MGESDLSDNRQEPVINLISVNMGYGHQRAAYPLLCYSGRVLNIFGEDEDVKTNRFFWRLSQCSYNFLTRAERIPLFGRLFFRLLEGVEKIEPYYPVRDQSGSTYQTRTIQRIVENGMGKRFYQDLAGNGKPIVTTFFTSGFSAEKYTDLPVICIVCDADINRAWVANRPENSRIRYCAASRSAARRLQAYGVPPERIHLTGFPLPQENIGDFMEILRRDTAYRIARLDPKGNFKRVHGTEAESELQVIPDADVSRSPVTVTFAVGGTGAQKEMAADILEGLKPGLESRRVHLNLVAGIREDVYRYFIRLLAKKQYSCFSGVRIVYAPDLISYFTEFNRILRNTDILWSKPSELSFYCGLGLPVVMAPGIGPQEEGNREWLIGTGAGLAQKDPRYCSEWIMDWMDDGVLAGAAWNGYRNVEKNGVSNIIRIAKSAM